MPSLDDYVDREQAYVKHVFLERYLEALFHKTGNAYNHIVHVDGFAGPWQSADENFEDTSFGIALCALRKSKATLQAQRGRNVRMTALLVEKRQTSHAQLLTLQPRFQDVEIKAYHGGFIETVPALLQAIPRNAFAFFLIDPKGWGIPVEKLRPLLSYPKSEVLFNFMFDFINRAAGMQDKEARSGQSELFESFYEMTPDDMSRKLADEKKRAAELVLNLSPRAPDSIPYKTLWARVLAKHAVRKPDVNKICADLRRSGELVFPNWESDTRKRVPDDHDRVQRP